MGAAIFIVDLYSEPHWTRSTFRIMSGTDQKGAFLREMLQESWEIYTLWLGHTGVPYKWIAALDWNWKCHSRTEILSHVNHTRIYPNKITHRSHSASNEGLQIEQFKNIQAAFWWGRKCEVIAQH